MNGKRSFLLLVLTALVLSAFGRPPAPRPDSDARVILQYLTVVKADGSAEFHFIFKYSQEQLKEILDAGQVSEDEICEKTFSQTGDAAFSFTQEQHGEEIWCTNVTNLDTLEDLSDKLKDDFNSLTVNRLEIKDGKFYLDLSWSEFPCTTPDPSQFTCEWAVEAPGKVGNNNATRVEGNTITWDLSVSGTPRRFKAESATGGGFDPTLAIVLVLLSCGCCTVLLLVAGIILFFILRKRKQSSDTPTATETPPPVSPPSSADTIKL
jgi:hypothetical protein